MFNAHATTSLSSLLQVYQSYQPLPSCQPLQPPFPFQDLFQRPILFYDRILRVLQFLDNNPPLAKLRY